MDNIERQFTEKYHVSRETYLQLSEYVRLLKKWQAKVNLISNSTLDDIWHRHIEDSLQLIHYVPRETSSIIDIGSGGGLPGIVLAIASKLPTSLIESDKKKCSFLSEVARIAGINNCKIYANRIESAKLDIQHKQNIVITARAVAEIIDIFALVINLINNNGITDFTLILPKGKTAAIEIERAKSHWNFDFTSHKTITDPDASILVIRNIRSKI